MTNLEHYFENLLYHGEDVKSEANKNALTEEQQKAVEQCAQYVIYSMFGTRDRFDEWINRDAASTWHRVEDELPEIGQPVVVSYYGDMWTATRLDDKRFNGRMYWMYSDGYWVRIEDDMYWMLIPEPPKEEA